MIEKNTLNIRMLVLCGLFSALIVVGAMIKVPLPGIPFTLQTLFVILAGLLLGPRGGLIAVLVYIFIGLAGLPVFSGGGGLMYVLKPSFGYIVGFALGAFVTGWLSEKNTNNSTLSMVIAALAGTAVIYARGADLVLCDCQLLPQHPGGCCHPDDDRVCDDPAGRSDQDCIEHSAGQTTGTGAPARRDHKIIFGNVYVLRDKNK